MSEGVVRSVVRDIGIGIGRRRKSYWKTRYPSGLTAIVYSDTKAKLNWLNNGVADFTGIKVYYSTDNVTFTLKDTITSIVESCIVTGLTANTLYYFKIALYKVGSQSQYSSVASCTTLFNDADIWVDSNLALADKELVTTLEDKTASNNDFTGSGATRLSYRSNGDYLCNIATNSAMKAALSAGFQSLSYAEFYLVLQPSWHASVNQTIFSYRNASTELLQLAYTFADKKLNGQMRTNTGAIQTTANDCHVKRSNIIRIIFDKPNNVIKYKIDDVETTLNYAFSIQLVRSTELYILSYYVGTGGGFDFGFKELMCYFSDKLDATKRTTIYNYLENKFNPSGRFIKSVSQTLAELVAATPQLSDYFVTQDVYDLVTAGTINQYDITTSDNPQTIFDVAPAGSLVRFKAGTHNGVINKNRSILYCDKKMYVELEAGAILKLADNSNTLDYIGELVTNQGTQRTQEGFSYRGIYTGNTFKDLVVKIDGTGSPNTFKWGFDIWEPTYGTTGVTITGGWQSIAEGIEIKFDYLTGYAIDNTWIVCFDGAETYGIRVGTGFHSNYIHDVKIFGSGTIDMNYTKQVPSSLHAKNLPSCILGHGRLKDVGIYSLTLQNCQRLIMLYGDNNSEYSFGGAIAEEQTYDLIGAEVIAITGVNDWAPGVNGAGGSGILLGHPEHRGKLSNVKANLNTIATYLNSIECNFRLRNYEVRNNHFRGSEVTTRDIARWRESMDGFILNNNASATYNDAPTGWNKSRNVYVLGNVRS
jgi:hypothetical protein